MATIKIDVESLEKGYRTAEDIKTSGGQLVIRKNILIENKHLNLLKSMEITEVNVIEPDDSASNKQVDHINNFPEHKEKLKNAGVLIVDDAKSMRLILKKLITGAGLKVVGEAEDGEKAIELAGKLKPAIVTLDIEMPNMGGLEAIEEIIKVSPETRIIMISSEAQDFKISQATAKGAYNFVTKPFTKAEPVKTVIDAIIS